MNYVNKSICNACVFDVCSLFGFSISVYSCVSFWVCSLVSILCHFNTHNRTHVS